MKSLLSAITASVLTALFILYGYELPIVFRLVDKIKSIPEYTIASTLLEDEELALENQQKSVAMLVKLDSGYFIEIDNAIGNQFTRASVSKIVDRRLIVMRKYAENLADHFGSGENQALWENWGKRHKIDSREQALIYAFSEELRNDPFVYSTMKQRFPDASDEDIVRSLLFYNDTNKQPKTPDSADIDACETMVTP